jgi:hypothetical protein
VPPHCHIKTVQYSTVSVCQLRAPHQNSTVQYRKMLYFCSVQRRHIIPHTTHRISLKSVQPVPNESVQPVSIKSVQRVFNKSVQPLLNESVQPVLIKSVQPVLDESVQPLFNKSVQPWSEQAKRRLPNSSESNRRSDKTGSQASR